MSLLLRIWRKPPIAFPILLLFHVGLLCYILYDAIVDPVGGLLLVQPLSLLLYTIAWLFVCDLKRWAGYTYMALATLNLGLRFFLTSSIDRAYFTDVLFPADIVFTVIVILYIKKFD